MRSRDDAGVIAAPPGRRGPRWPFLGIALLLLLTLTGRAAAQEEDVDRKARTRFAAGQYKEALDLYAQLYADTLHPTYLRNVGRCYQNLGEPDKAISSFQEYLRKVRAPDPKDRAEVEGFIREMEALKAGRSAPRPPPGAAPVIPREPASPLLARSPPPPAEPPPLHTRWWFWAGLGAVVVGGLAAAAAGGAFTTTKDASCPKTFGECK